MLQRVDEELSDGRSKLTTTSTVALSSWHSPYSPSFVIADYRSANALQNSLEHAARAA